MKRTKIKILCFVLVLALILPTSVCAYGTGNDYPAKYKNASNGTVVDEWNFYNRQCTSFVAWCLNSRNGVAFTNQYKGASRWGHAKTWGTVAKKLGITVDKNPAVGAVAWWNTGTYGHVAWVKSVNGSNITIEEYNWSVAGGYGERTLASSAVTGGFIHIKDISSATTPPQVPNVPDVVVEGSKAIVSWGSVKGAEKYIVDFWNEEKGHSYSETTSTSITKTYPDGVYGVRVCAENSAGPSGFSKFSYITLPANKNTTVQKEQAVDDGLYTLKNVSSGYMMNVYDGKDANGTKVTTWQYDGTTDQRIYIQHKGDGKYLLKFNASSNGRVIDVNRGESLSASIDDGDKIDIWTADDLTAQYFFINSCENGAYSFELASKIGYVIAAENEKSAASNGTQLQLKKWTGADYQKWYLCDKNGNVIGACSHAKTQKKVTSSFCEEISDGQHKVITEYNEICSDCKEVIKSNLTEESTEPHSLSNNKCEKCDYEVTIEEISCKHMESYEEIKQSDVKTNDELYHCVTEIYDIYCNECNSVIKENQERSCNEEHIISDNICSECGYIKETAEEVIEEEKTETLPAYSDISDKELAEVVDTLSGFNIINGYSDGSFKPQNKITRAEFSKIICLTIMCGEAAATGGSFRDVSQSHWAKNYIYSAKNIGVINGMSETTFAPDANITYEQAIKMIVAALGYSDEAEQKGGYPTGYIAVAKELGITEGISYNKTAYSTRGNIAKLVRNAMNVPFYILSNEYGVVKKDYSSYTLYELHNGR